jgi:hypothetical protein
MFVAGLKRMRRTSETNISSKKKLHNKLRGAVQVNKMRKSKKNTSEFKLSDMK